MQDNLRSDDDSVADDETRVAGDENAEPDEDARSRTSGRARFVVARVLWAAHWLLRIWLAGYLLVYGWSKVFLMQMGRTDYADALVQYGEMSPMGLLWRFMAFSPTVQILAGLAEVAAAAFLLFRRTAWLGAVLGATDMAIVFLLNLTFDVPVKQLSGIMALTGIVILIPNLPRLCRFLIGRDSGPSVAGRISSNRIFMAITRWTSSLLAIAMIVGSGVVFGNTADWGRFEAPSEIAGVYTVADNGKSDFGDSELTQVAFGQVTKDGRAAVGLRYLDGSFQEGTYSIKLNGQLTMKLYPKQKGSQGLVRDYVDELTLTYAVDGSGIVRMTGEGLDTSLIPDPERRYLFDRDFSWTPRVPINR